MVSNKSSGKEGRRGDVQGYGVGLPNTAIHAEALISRSGWMSDREQGMNPLFCFTCAHSFTSLIKLSSPQCTSLFHFSPSDSLLHPTAGVMSKRLAGGLAVGGVSPRQPGTESGATARKEAHAHELRWWYQNPTGLYPSSGSSSPTCSHLVSMGGDCWSSCSSATEGWQNLPLAPLSFLVSSSN